jgi:hypothetical protein
MWLEHDFWELKLFPPFRGIGLIWNRHSHTYSVVMFYCWKYNFLEAECSCHEVETRTENPSVSGPLYWPNFCPWPNPVETTEYTSYNTCVVNETHFLDTVAIKFALLLLWLLCLHGKLVTMVVIEFGLWLHTLGLNGNHSLWFLVSHWFLGCHGYGPKLLWWSLFLSAYAWVTLVNQLPWVW